MANSSLNISSLDFDTLKQNFKNYLISQSVLKDYDFEGSNINVLLDVMTYNSYLNSFYLNMVASEMFLDTAQKLDSVISHAKELNYLPRSNRSAKAVINININTTGINNPFVLPKGTVFSGTNSNGFFNFVTDREQYYLSSDRVYRISNLEIYEGSYMQDSFTMDYTSETQKFIISNFEIDTNSLEITVSENSVNTTFAFAENLYNLDYTSNVYFLQATSNKQYEIVFGDDIFGRKPKNGAIITANYRITSGSDGNGITSFTLDSDLGTVNDGYATNDEVVTVSGALSGANSEGIESIRFNAPRHYQTQGRCVTDNDYGVLLLQNYPEIQYVNVYGGEITNTEVNFGTVFISPSTFSGNVLTDTRKSDIVSFVNKLSPIGIRVKIIDPDYLYVTINSVIHTNLASTTSSPASIINKVTNAIKAYNTDSLQNFNTAFRLSRLEQKINEADIGILSNETVTKLYRIFSPEINQPTIVTCNFNNSIEKGSVISSKFITGGKNYVFTDYIEGVTTGNGVLYQYEQENTPVKIYTEVGSINYTTGLIYINSIEYFNIFGGLKIFATTKNKDIYCKNNSIIEIDTISGLSLTTVNE
jgi:hypothetical protein